MTDLKSVKDIVAEHGKQATEDRRRDQAKALQSELPTFEVQIQKLLTLADQAEEGLESTAARIERSLRSHSPQPELQTLLERLRKQLTVFRETREATGTDAPSLKAVLTKEARKRRRPLNPEQKSLFPAQNTRGLTRQGKILAAAEAILGEDATQAGSLGYIARLLAQVGLPHSEIMVPAGKHGKEAKAQIYARSNGEVEVRINSLHGAGIPFGSIPRVLLAYVSTEAVQRKSRDIVLGKNLSRFLEEHMDMPATGGVNGSITRVKEQAWRLFGSGISIIGERTETQKRREAAFVSVSDKIKQEERTPEAKEEPTIWSPLQSHQSQVWDTELRLSELFFQGLIERPVPIDWRAVRALKQSSLALDIYFWLTHRMSYLRKRTLVPWSGDGSLQVQMGAQYDDSPQGRYSFRKAFEEQLKGVLALYPGARVEVEAKGLILRPSATHVRNTPKPSKS